MRPSTRGAMRPGSGYGRRRRTTASSRLKIAVLAPIPRPRASTAINAKPGLCRKRRRPYLRSWSIRSASRLEGMLLHLPRFQAQIHRRPPRRLVHPVLVVDAVQEPEPEVDGVERAAAGLIETAAVGHVGEAAAEDARFEERLAQPVEQVVDEREGVVGERALLLDLEARRERRLPQLLGRIEPDVERPDAGQRSAADVGAEEG